MPKKTQIICALDVKTTAEALSLLDRMDNSIEYIKIGPRLFALGGKEFIKQLSARKYKVFLDLKLHDIPNTVALAVDAFAELGLWALTVHSAGGRSMLRAAKNAAGDRLKLFGISVLTSIDDASWAEVGGRAGVKEAVELRASLCADEGIAGLVSSPHELSIVKRIAPNILAIVPGIRPDYEPQNASSAKSQEPKDDQKRIASPAYATKAGADFLVIGRPIIEARDPVYALKQLNREVEEAKL